MKMRGEYSGNREFRQLLSECSLSQAAFARITDTYPTTVSGWATDKHEVPPIVLAFLRLYRDVKAALPRS